MALIPMQDIISLVVSIFALAIVVPSSLFFRHYSRLLDMAQSQYLFALILATSSFPTFSLKLGYTWLSFIPSFLNFCTTGDYVCSYGNLLSMSICTVGAIMLMFVIVKLIRIKKPQAKFQTVYNFMKGFFRWTMPPLIYYSIITLIPAIQSSKFDSNFIASAVVLGFFVILMIAEVIGYKCTQNPQQNIWKKWIQFLSNARIFLIMLIMGLGKVLNPLAYYFVYGPIVLYGLIYSFKYKFHFKVIERVFYLLGQALFITIFSLYLFQPSYIYQYDLDLIFIAIVILLDIITFIIKLIAYAKSTGEEDQQVNPEIVEDKIRKSNNFEDIYDLNNSNDNLMTNPSSPRRAPKKQPKKRY